MLPDKLPVPNIAASLPLVTTYQRRFQDYSFPGFDGGGKGGGSGRAFGEKLLSELEPILQKAGEVIGRAAAKTFSELAVVRFSQDTQRAPLSGIEPRSQRQGSWGAFGTTFARTWQQRGMQVRDVLPIIRLGGMPALAGGIAGAGLAAVANAPANAQRALDGQAQLAYASPSIAANKALADAAKMLRDFQFGQKVADSNRELNAAMDRLQRQLQPIQVLLANAGNFLNAEIVKKLTDLLEAGNKLVGLKPDNAPLENPWISRFQRAADEVQKRDAKRRVNHRINEKN